MPFHSLEKFVVLVFSFNFHFFIVGEDNDVRKDVNLDRHEDPPVPFMVDVILDEATEGSVFLSPTMLMTDSSSADMPMETQEEPSIDEEQNITSAYPLLETSRSYIT